MIDNTLAYWMALAHARNFSTRRKMEFLIESVHEKYTIQEALTKIKSNDKLGFNFSDKEWEGILESVNDLPNYAFLAERIEDQGIHTMNIWDKYVYPASLKQNLKKEAPFLIYAKGNMDLLKKESIAIVGARMSRDISLKFTENVAKMTVRKNQVVVSGFAKGVDKKALEAALEHKGQSIIVLPQGIETYKSKTYYQDIVKGNVLVMSIYHPKAPWSVGLAMDRNKIIYGLANQIYVAESNSSGGTWEGVLNGLKRGRKIFVRNPDGHENNANVLLIQKGASPVDFYGNELQSVETTLFKEPEIKLELKPVETISESTIANKVIEMLRQMKGRGITTKEIAERLNLDDKLSKQLAKLLGDSPSLTKQKKGRNNYFTLKEITPEQGNLF